LKEGDKTDSELSEICGSHGGEDVDCGFLGRNASLKMEATRSSENIVTTYNTTRRQNP
jgi:hypothetical protein